MDDNYLESSNIQDGVQVIDNINYDDDINQKEIQLGAPNDPSRKKKKKKKKKRVDDDNQQGEEEPAVQQQQQQQEEVFIENKEIIESALDSFRAISTLKNKKKQQQQQQQYDEMNNQEQTQDAVDLILQEQDPQITKMDDGNYQQNYYDQTPQPLEQINDDELGGGGESQVKKKKKKKKKKPIESQQEEGLNNEYNVNPEYNQDNQVQYNDQEQFGYQQEQYQPEQRIEIDNLIIQLQQDQETDNQKQQADQNNQLFTDDNNNFQTTLANNTLVDTEQNELVPPTKTKKKKKKKKNVSSSEQPQQEGDYDGRIVLQADSINNLDDYGNQRSDSSNMSPEKQRIIQTAEKHKVERDKIIYEEDQKDQIDDFNQSGVFKDVNQSLNMSQLNASGFQDDQRFLQNNSQMRRSSRFEQRDQPIVLNDDEQQQQYDFVQNMQMNAPYGPGSGDTAQQYKQSTIKRLCNAFWNSIQYDKQSQPFAQKSDFSKWYSPNPQLLRPKTKPLNIHFGNMKVNSQPTNNSAPASSTITLILYTLLQVILKKINIYYFFLGVIASLFFWENSRNFSCMIALYLFSIFAQVIIDFNLKKKRLYAAQSVDNISVLKRNISSNSFEILRRGNLRQGDIVKVKEGEILPADLLLIASSSESIFINLDTHESKSGFDRKFIPSEIRQQDKSSLLNNSIQGTITSQCDTLATNSAKWEGIFKASSIQSGIEIKITEENIGIKNSRLIDTEFIVGIVIFHSSKSKYNGVNFEKQLFSHPLNSYISLHVFISFALIILFSIILSILGASFADEASNSYPYLKKVDKWFKVFMNYEVILAGFLPIFLYPIMSIIDLVQACLINRMPDDWDELIKSQKLSNLQSNTNFDQEMKPLGHKQEEFDKPKRNIIKGEKEFVESTKKLKMVENEKQSAANLELGTVTQNNDKKEKKSEISVYKDIILDGQKISYLGNINVIVSDLENVNERYTEFQGFTAYDILFDQNNSSHLFDGLGEREIQQVIKLFKFGLMSNGKSLQSREDIALKEYCEKLEIKYEKGEEENQFKLITMDVEELFNINFQMPYNRERQYQSTYIGKSSGENQILMRGHPEVVMEKMTMDKELQESVKNSIRQFRARGYTCQILATKYIDDTFYTTLNNIKEKTAETDVALSLIENNLEYLGLFAFKTFYRDPFARFSQSSVKTWYFTEQPYQLQQNILKESSYAPSFRLSQTDDALLMKEIEYQFKLYRLGLLQNPIMRQISNYKIKFNMESDGKVLYTLLQSKDPNMEVIKVKFLTLMLHAQNCVIWNMDPLLKSTMISQVKGCISPEINFLGIGTSEKDIPIMQSCDVSLIYCRDQSKMPDQSSSQFGILPYADGKISNFKQLNYLLFSYGRQHYRKSQQIAMFMIEKNIVFTTFEFIYAFYVMYSGQLFFSNVIYFFYEAVFSCWGVAFFYLFDFDIQLYQQIEYPQVYLQGSLNKLTTISSYFYKWITSFLQGLFIFFISVYTLQEAVDGTGMVLNHGFTQICAVFTVFNLMKYKQIMQSTNISYHYWILVIDYIFFITIMYILQTTGVSRVSYSNLNKMVAAFFSSTSSFFIFLTIGFICIIPEIIILVKERLLKRNPIYQIVGFNYGLYERKVNQNAPILTQKNYKGSYIENLAKITPEEKVKLGFKKQLA